jgi:hypothetical protein
MQINIKGVLELHALWLQGDPKGIRADLSWANLSGANLSRANLSGAYLSGADLSRANLSRANLSWANLSGANLSGANLSGADLSGADLSWANLSWANLSRANLSRANLSWANLSWANLSRANLSRADLSGADLSGADLNSVVGNMLEVKSAHFDKWVVTWTGEVIQIGCQRHAITLWEKADPRWIDAMAPDATKWWGKYGAIVMALVEASPAKPTGYTVNLASKKG